MVMSTPTPISQNCHWLSILNKIKTNHHNTAYKSMLVCPPSTTQACCPLAYSGCRGPCSVPLAHRASACTGPSARNTLPSDFPSLTPPLPAGVTSDVTFSGTLPLFSLKDQMLLTSQVQFYICLGVYLINIWPFSWLHEGKIMSGLFTNLFLCWMSE